MVARLAAVIVLLALAACAAAAPTPPATPSAPPPGTATPSPTATPTTTPSATAPAVPTLRIEPAVVPDPPPNSGMSAVVSAADGYVAFAFDGQFGTLLWTSDDGTVWEDATPAGFESRGVAGATVRDGRIVAVGRAATTDIEAETAGAIVSEDGRTWTDATGDDMRGQMVDVIGTQRGLIAVGGVPGADAAGFWRSDDGTGWERIGDDLPAAFLWSLAEGGPGYVAVGWRRDPEPSVAVWTSTDGSTWELAPDPEANAGFEATDVVATPSGALVMVGGNVAGGEGRIWTSTDGLTWTVAEVDGGLADAGVRSVTVTDRGLVAVGSVGMDAAGWMSVDDGATWTRVATVPEAYFDEALATDGGLVLTGATQIGTVETGIEARAAIWVVTFE